jgi:putative phosphoesterase
VKVALVSDLHGNELAMVAVRRRIVELGADQVICLGDVATLGARPREILDHLRDLGAPCILGNHDEFLLDPELVHTYTEAPIIADAVDWCRAALRAEDLAFVGTFARERELDLDGTRLLLFHGSPRSNMENLLATTAADDLEVALDGRRAPVMAGGHTHLALVRQHRGALLVNPGSVGMPIVEFVSGREPRIMDHAEFAVIDAAGGAASVTLHRVPLDRRALRAQAESADHPLRAGLSAQYA